MLTYYALLVWGDHLTKVAVDSVAPIWIANVAFAALTGFLTFARTRPSRRTPLGTQCTLR